MKGDRPFLMTRARLVPIHEVSSHYDPRRALSVDACTGEPLVLAQSAVTHSKTAARPGDDDPDPGQDRCY